MRPTRWLIETATRFICYVKRSRRINHEKFGAVLKINLGCGLTVARGWTNVDGSLNALIASWPGFIHRLAYLATGANRYYTSQEYTSLLSNHVFVHHDLSYGIPFYGNSANYIYTSHFLEHMTNNDARAFLAEAYRVLKQGGFIRVCVPDLAYAIKLYHEGDKDKMLTNYFFNEDLDSAFARHKYMYDADLLRDSLEQAGFRNIRTCAYRQGTIPDLEILDNRPEETLFMEAQK